MTSNSTNTANNLSLHVRMNKIAEEAGYTVTLRACCLQSSVQSAFSIDPPAFSNFPNVYFIAKMSHFTVETQPQKCLGTVQKCFYIGKMF